MRARAELIQLRETRLLAPFIGSEGSEIVHLLRAVPLQLNTVEATVSGANSASKAARSGAGAAAVVDTIAPTVEGRAIAQVYLTAEEFYLTGAHHFLIFLPSCGEVSPGNSPIFE